MDFIAGASPRQLARVAGALYLINIVGGAFAIGIVPAMVVVPGDAAATAHNSYARAVALLVVLFTLVGTAVEAGGLLNQFAPLVLLASGPYRSALPAAQLQALAYMPGDLSAIGYSSSTVFFGCYAICISYLVVRSTFLPGAIGVLMAIDGLAYLVYSFADLLTPGFAAYLVPWIQLPTLFGEGSLCLWLLAVGVEVERWKERASPGNRMRSAPMEALA